MPWPGKSSGSGLSTAFNTWSLASKVASGNFDILHSFSRVAYLAPLLPLAIPKIMTYQRPVTPRSIKWGHFLSRGTLSFTAISDWMTRDVEHLGRWDMVPNGVSTETYDFNPACPPDAPLAFLGRIEEIKGPHLAIEVARRSNRRLIIAGNIPAECRGWADRHVLADVDGHQIQYIGAVDDRQKNALLRNSAALLMPILWDEPFGIVMAEAMACGTPVLGFRRGAVPEVVVDGVTGFISETVAELTEAVARVGSISRADCRARVELLYSGPAVVEGYLNVYRSRLNS